MFGWSDMLRFLAVPLFIMSIGSAMLTMWIISMAIGMAYGWWTSTFEPSIQAIATSAIVSLGTGVTAYGLWKSRIWAQVILCITVFIVFLWQFSAVLMSPAIWIAFMVLTAICGSQSQRQKQLSQVVERLCAVSRAPGLTENIEQIERLIAEDHLPAAVNAYRDAAKVSYDEAGRAVHNWKNMAPLAKLQLLTHLLETTSEAASAQGDETSSARASQIR